SLPDVFGNLIFKEWLEFNHKKAVNISPLEQLTYVGKRGMGALEFMPSKTITTEAEINIDESSEVVKKVLDVKSSIHEKNLSDLALRNIFKIGTSAGGARPKILISEHKHTGVIIAGDLEYSEEYNHYLIKLAIDEGSGYSRS